MITGPNATCGIGSGRPDRTEPGTPTLKQRGTLLQMTVPIDVISLARTHERRERFAAQNPGLHFTFFDAVDGQALDIDALWRDGTFGGYVSYSSGALGCALSHRGLWDKAEKEQRVVTVVEDDAILRADFASASRAVIERLEADWDIVMWGWNFDAALSLNVMPNVSPMVVLTDQAEMRQSIDRFRTETGMPHPIPLAGCLGTCAYSISPKGAAIFRAACFPLKTLAVPFPLLALPIQNTGIDIAMNALYPSVQSFVAIPPLAITPNVNAESLTVATHNDKWSDPQ